MKVFPVFLVYTHSLYLLFSGKGDHLRWRCAIAVTVPHESYNFYGTHVLIVTCKRLQLNQLVVSFSFAWHEDHLRSPSRCFKH